MIVLPLIGVLAMLGLIVGYKLWSANRDIERVLKTNATLEQTVRTQAGEIQQQKAELSNAQVKQKHTGNVQRGANGSIDEQLRKKGWFRD